MLEIARVTPRGTGAETGLGPGDGIITVNNHEIQDLIDYKFHITDERISLLVRKSSGEVRKIALHKAPDDDLGLEFPPLRIKRCRNRCIFCFVDQMPEGCRRSLYVKDDDFRASFLHGNYITLGAISEDDWERILGQRLSPLYISVHATDPELRAFMLGTARAPDIMTQLKRLAAGGITMHAQLVLCPGINDGRHLARTVHDLAGLFPAVSSIAAVPVGLTAHRKGLFPLRPFTPAQARAVLDIVKPLGMQFKRKFGTRLVFPSDEFYLKAGEQVPPALFYEDFPQIENGVGMVAEFLSEAARARLPARIAPKKATVVTGASFSRILPPVLKRLKKVNGAVVEQVTARNTFFGPAVTVSGLLTGRDILSALKGKRLGDMVMIPANALHEDEDVFLDGMTLAHLSRTLSVPVHRVGSFRDMVTVLREKGEGMQ